MRGTVPLADAATTLWRGTGGSIASTFLSSMVLIAARFPRTVAFAVCCASVWLMSSLRTCRISSMDILPSTLDPSQLELPRRKR